MGLSQECRACLFRRQLENVKDVEQCTRESYLKNVAECIWQEDTAPVVTERISILHERYFHSKYSFDILKKYNQMMLQWEEEIGREFQKVKAILKH